MPNNLYWKSGLLEIGGQSRINFNFGANEVSLGKGGRWRG